MAFARERWPGILGFEHATLPAPRAFEREGDEFLVLRGPAPGRPLSAGRVPDAKAPALFLQAASVLAALAAAGTWADTDDLLESTWDVSEGSARLWLAGTPSGVAAGAGTAGAAGAAGIAAPPPCDSLSALLERLFRRRGHVADSAAAGLLERLRAPESRALRPDFWVAAAYTSFPCLGSWEAAPARLRTAGSLRPALDSACRRASFEKGKAILEGRAIDIRILDPASPLFGPTRAAAPGAHRSLWICVAMDEWSPLVREAVEAEAASRDGIEILAVPGRAPAPALPDEWRSAFFVPCGSVTASLRFYERLARAAESAGREAARMATSIVADPCWAAFASDATGDARLPEAEAEPPADPAGPAARRKRRRRTAPEKLSPGERIESVLATHGTARALEEAARWRSLTPYASVEFWFPMAARLSAAIPLPAQRPAWLEGIEAERELAGGRARESEECLRRVLASRDASEEERRAAALRRAELAGMRGRPTEAAELACEWRASNPGAEPREILRALRVEASGASRLGEHDRAWRLLDEADAIAGFPAGELPNEERIETALVRAGALSRAGRIDEEAALYASAKALVSKSGDERGMARLLAAEALGLADRRDFAASIARLEEALSILGGDSVERARISIDLAATLHHAGRPERTVPLLRAAAALAAEAGREDLARIARGNLVEACIHREEWAAASAGAENLLGSARAAGDPVWTLVALHHRSRIALRTGRLQDASRDNAVAQRIAGEIGDRLEIGELRLEDGDRAALEGSADEARRAWSAAACDPPDRDDAAERARSRLEELKAFQSESERGSDENVARLGAAASDRIARGDYAAAESVARWARLAPGRIPGALARAAAALLRARGGDLLADTAFGASPRGTPPSDPAALRRLRDLVGRCLAGEEPDGGPLPLGLSGLSLRSAGREVARLGRAPNGSEEPPPRYLRSGAVDYELRLWPEPPGGGDEAALVLETLLFRPAPPALPAEFARGWSRLGVVAADASMEEPYRRLARFAPLPITVLVLGESGSGKEAVARAVHSLSPRAGGRFVAVNVSAIPAALLESELFGHARGAFTGAERDRAGLFEEAAAGTIFFDEIGDLAAALQAKLLRALQEGEIRRVGENRPRRVDVRVVSATSRDLAAEVDAGRFREDLFYRLQVAVIRLPPLRERGRDVLLLARQFLQHRTPALDLAPETVAAILAHSWPGNVRELQSAIFSGAALADGPRLELAHLPEGVRRAARPAEKGKGYRSRVNAHRRSLIMEALDRAGGNRSRAARELQLSRQALLYLIRELKVGGTGASRERAGPSLRSG